MTIKAAQNKRRGVHTFYVTSDSGREYIVQFFRRAGLRGFSCTCPDWTFRRQVKRTHRACKHIAEIRARQVEEHGQRLALESAQLATELLETEGDLGDVSEETRTMLEQGFFANARS